MLKYIINVVVAKEIYVLLRKYCLKYILNVVFKLLKIYLIENSKFSMTYTSMYYYLPLLYRAARKIQHFCQKNVHMYFLTAYFEIF